MSMTKEQYIAAVKRGDTVNVSQNTAIEAHWAIINEFLNVIQAALLEALIIASGDPNLLYDDERSLFELYASWDHHNKGDRKTSAELVAEFSGEEEEDGNKPD
jgi:hypothetical protein